LLLYEKYGDDIFYFIHLFSGMQVSFPKSTKTLKILQFSQACKENLVRNESLNGLPKSEQERKVVEELNKLYSPISRMYELVTPVDNAPEGTLDIRDPQPLGVSLVELPAPGDPDEDSRGAAVEPELSEESEGVDGKNLRAVQPSEHELQQEPGAPADDPGVLPGGSEP